MEICCAGEVMIELAATGRDDLYRRGVAGDSFNTAVHLARAGLPVSYLTRLGDDPLSDAILAAMTAEQVAVDRVTRCPGRQPGLYTIDNDADGERHFSYWRDRAPARECFASVPDLAGVSHFYFTGITLAVTRADTGNLVALLETLRGRGCSVIFDPNYRAALWDGPEQAQAHYRAVLPLCDTALPTLQDERLLWGTDTAQACRDLYADAGVTEIVIKGDELTTHVHAGGEWQSWQAAQVAALDTAGAGDAYNAGYLAARLAGADVETAVRRAQQLSAQVVQQRGALPPRMAPSEEI
ncbi:MAG: sugar kinase [Halioglobus sp.]|nr:sugar kinase [Halioglobus sp.]